MDLLNQNIKFIFSIVWLVIVIFFNFLDFLFFHILYIFIFFYFIPYFAAKRIRHKNITIIFIVDLFFGWTIIGWIICLAWAFSGAEKKHTFLTSR